MKTIIQNKPRTNKELASSLSKEVNLSPIITEFMCDKGYKTKEDILNFIDFKEENLRKVSDMKDGALFINTLKQAILNKKNIVIYGDYDGDGVCATTILMRTLSNLCHQSNCPLPNWFISNRFKEGYGLSVAGMKRLIDTYPKVNLIVTCDNGIVAFDGVDYAKQRNIDVIVSDHHNASPDGRLPNCLVVCEKRLDEDKSKEEDFCGAELARRICVELVELFDKTEQYKSFLDTLYGFSGFATITDVITLNAANHYVVKRGLSVINKNKLDCFNVMKQVLELREKVNEITIGYKLGPMINAAGRILGEATIPVQLFLSRNNEERLLLANQLLSLNERRQELSLQEQKVVQEEILINEYDKDYFICVSGGNYQEGIAGLNASFIVDNYKVPAICLCKTEVEGILKGSARSIDGFNIKQALDKCADLLLGYGGHSGAAGLSIKQENLYAFRERMNKLCSDIENFQEIIDIDYLLNPKEVTVKLSNEYENILAPFGEGFEHPLFAVCGVFKAEPIIMKEKHIKTFLYNNQGKVTLLWFNSVLKYELKHPDNKQVLAIGQPSENTFNNVTTSQFIADNIYSKDEENITFNFK